MWKIELNLDVDDSDKLPVRKRECERENQQQIQQLVGGEADWKDPTP